MLWQFLPRDNTAESEAANAPAGRDRDQGGQEHRQAAERQQAHEGHHGPGPLAAPVLSSRIDCSICVFASFSRLSHATANRRRIAVCMLPRSVRLNWLLLTRLLFTRLLARACFPNESQSRSRIDRWILRDSLAAWRCGVRASSASSSSSRSLSTSSPTRDSLCSLARSCLERIAMHYA